LRCEFWGPRFRICVQGSGLNVYSGGFRVCGSGFEIQGLGFRARGLEAKDIRDRVSRYGFRVKGLRFRAQGLCSWFRVRWAKAHGLVFRCPG
jgi:hypothetical protein